MKIQLLYFPGCPHIDAARSALREAMRAEGIDGVIEEIDVESLPGSFHSRDVSQDRELAVGQ